MGQQPCLQVAKVNVHSVGTVSRLQISEMTIRSTLKLQVPRDPLASAWQLALIHASLRFMIQPAWPLTAQAQPSCLQGEYAYFFFALRSSTSWTACRLSPSSPSLAAAEKASEAFFIRVSDAFLGFCLEDS